MSVRAISLLAISLCAASCGGDEREPPAPIESEVHVDTIAPAEATFSSMTTIAAGAAIESLGSSDSGRILVVAGGHTYEVGAESLEPRTLYAGPGEPTSTGRVYTITPRMEGGAWMAADAGLFIVDTLYVVRSPLHPGDGSIKSTAHLSGGSLSGLWLAGDDGLFRSRGVTFEKYPLEHLGMDAIEAIAITGDGSSALALAHGEIALLETTGQEISSDKPPLEAGVIHGVAAGRTQLYAASDKGLLRFDRTATPKWTRFTFGTEEPVLAVAADAPTDTAYARTRSSVIRVRGSELARFSAFDADQNHAALLALDTFGDLWMGNSGDLERRTPGMITEDVTYAADVLPWIMRNCSMCHRNQTQDFEDYAVFREVAEMALTRVRAGDMPRCTGGIPCAGARLEPSEYSVLESWIRDGKAE